jgi:hypothetical protein
MSSDKYRYKHLKLTKDRKKARENKIFGMRVDVSSAESIEAYVHPPPPRNDDVYVEDIPDRCQCCGVIGDVTDNWDKSKLCKGCRHSNECCSCCGSWDGSSLCGSCRSD